MTNQTNTTPANRNALIAVLQHVKRREHRTTPFVAEHHDERHTEHRHGVLDGSQGMVADGVAGVSDDEQLAEPRTKQLLRPDTTVAAADQRGERSLFAGDLQPAVVGDVADGRRVGSKPTVAVDQTLKRTARGAQIVDHVVVVS